MMVQSAMRTASTLRVQTALLIYGRDIAGETRFEEHDGGDYDDGHEEIVGGEAFVSVHPARADKNGAVEIGPGRCLTHEELELLARQLLKTKTERRSIWPERVLCADGSRLVWYAPAARRPIYFATRDDKFNRAMNAQNVLHPALVFMADGAGLSVWALESDERPTEESLLFTAPYYNLYFSGRMCQGNARYPDSLGVESIALWESAFFETQFTHSNYHGVAVTTFKGGHDALWKAQKTATSFPASALVPAKVEDSKKPLTLGAAINFHIRGEG